MRKQAQILSVATILVLAAGLAVAAPDEPRDYEAARPYYAAALQGNADAQANLGALYLKGAGVPQSETYAFQWFLRAAEQGHAQAQLSLGEMFATGVGVARHDVLAYKWAVLAESNAGEADVRRRAADMINILARRMSDPEIAEARKLAGTPAPNSQTPSFELAAEKTAPSESRAERARAEARQAVEESLRPAVETKPLQPAVEAKPPAVGAGKPEADSAGGEQPRRAPVISPPERRPGRLAQMRAELEMAHRTFSLISFGVWQ
jgi:hypothetical protein